MPSSLGYFDRNILEFIEEHFGEGSRVLDVGAGDGRFGGYLKGSCRIDAVEPNLDLLPVIKPKYDNVYVQRAEEFDAFGLYDLVLLLDILEHLDPEAARLLLGRIRQAGCSIICKVPYLWEQGSEYGALEVHLQPDLTHSLFMERYPGFKLLVKDDVIGVYTDYRPVI